MKPQHVIYLTGSGVVLYTWDQHDYVPVSGYRLPGGYPGQLLAYLQQTPSATIAIVADVLDEEHIRDLVAPLGRRNQQQLLARKLARNFPRTPYRTALVQEHPPHDRKLRQVLLSGLTKPDHLRNLQEQLAAARLPVASVCSPALLSRVLVEKLGPPKPAQATLLVSRQREGSLRISFLRGRNLLGSRLMRQSVAAAPGDFGWLLQQLEESVRYFDAAYAPGANDPVDVILLCEPGIDPATATANGLGHDGFRLHVPAPLAAARKLGIHGALQPGNADLLFIGLLRRYAPAGNFAPLTDRRYFLHHQVHTFGRAACVAIATAGLLGASLNGAASLQIRQDREDVRLAISEMEQVLRGLGDQESPAEVDPLFMQRAVVTANALKRHDVAPDAVLSLVSAALERHPDIQLDELRWEPLAPNLTINADDEDTDAGEANAGNSGETGEASQIRLGLRAHVAPFDGNYPQAFGQMRAFMTTLERAAQVTSVTATKQPLDVNPRSTLTGEASPAARNDEATFSLDLALRMPDERT